MDLYDRGMEKLAIMFLALLFLAGTAHPRSQAPIFGFEIVSLNPAQFPDVLGVRDLYQSGAIARVDSTVPLPQFIRVTTRNGLTVNLRVTGRGPLGGGREFALAQAYRLD